MSYLRPDNPADYLVMIRDQRLALQRALSRAQELEELATVWFLLEEGSPDTRNLPLRSAMRESAVYQNLFAGFDFGDRYFPARREALAGRAAGRSS